MNEVIKCLEIFNEESKIKVLNNNECQFLSIVLNSDSRYNNVNCGYISPKEIEKHSNEIYQKYNKNIGRR